MRWHSGVRARAPEEVGLGNLLRDLEVADVAVALAADEENGRVLVVVRRQLAGRLVNVCAHSQTGDEQSQWQVVPTEREDGSAELARVQQHELAHAVGRKPEVGEPAELGDPRALGALGALEAGGLLRHARARVEDADELVLAGRGDLLALAVPAERLDLVAVLLEGGDLAGLLLRQAIVSE